MNLQDKLVVVTGASKGIGLATVNAFISAGAKVAGWSRSEPALTDENFLWIKTDMTSFVSVREAYEATEKHFGATPDVLVNNAGLGFEGRLVDTPLDDWHQMFDVNVHGLFYACKLSIPAMQQKGEGHIINISSIAGTTGIESMSGYCATKHAVRGLSHSLYKEVRNDGIKVTCVYPGSVNTNFFDTIDSVTANENMMRPEDIAQTILETVATYRNYHIVDIEMRPLKPKG